MHVISNVTFITNLGVNVFLIHTAIYLSQAPVQTHKPNCVDTNSVSHNANKQDKVSFRESSCSLCIVNITRTLDYGLPAALRMVTALPVYRTYYSIGGKLLDSVLTLTIENLSRSTIVHNVLIFGQLDK